ncbi:MAG: PilZ domain-containing protein [Vulcanimicrobiota bacterium]
MDDNRRRAPRVRNTIEVDFYGDDLRPHKARTINVGLRGMRMVCAGPTPGRHLQVALNLPTGRVTGLADAVWQETLDGDSTVVGLRFVSMQGNDCRRWHDFCGREAQKQARRVLPTSIPLPRPV